MSNPKNIVSVQKLSKSFKTGGREVHALSDVDLAVPQGQFLAVMGASGSGKSTLLHLIAGLTRPDSGTVSVDGIDIWKKSESERTKDRREKIGFVFQSFNLVSALTAEDNIMLPRLSAGQAPDHQRLEELLGYLGVSDRRQHRPDALSGGEQQRVAIARALYSQAELILADEPTGSLDSQNSKSICALLRKICDEQNKTVIVVTHEPSVAKWADSVVVLKDGRIESEFGTDEYSESTSIASHYVGLLE